MKLNKRLLIYLMFKTLLVIGEAVKNSKNRPGSRSVTPRTFHGAENTGRENPVVPTRPLSPGGFPSLPNVGTYGIQSHGTQGGHGTQTHGTQGGHDHSNPRSQGGHGYSSHGAQTPWRFPPPASSNQQPPAANNGQGTHSYAGTVQKQNTIPPPIPAASTRGIYHSEANEAKCTAGLTNKEFAHAKYCFDYFTLALSWVPGYALKLMKNGTQIRPDLVKPEWVVHGLWPSMFAKRAPMSNCTSNKSFSVRGKNKPDLHKHWYSIRNGVSNEDFWRHEYKDHGNCATRSSSIITSEEYFTKTLELYNNLFLSHTLKQGGFIPGKVKTLREILTIIKQKTQTQVNIRTVYNDGYERLAEVYICYDIQLKIMHCPYSDIENIPDDILQTRILYAKQL